MKKNILALIVIVLLVVSGCATKEKLVLIAPSVIPNTIRIMKSPGFWISRLDQPDKVVLNSENINLFNSKTSNELHLTEDIAGIGKFYPGRNIVDSLSQDLNSFLLAKFYYKHGKIVPLDFFRKIEKKINSSAIPSQVDVRYAFVLHYTDQRILPTDEILTVESGDIDFDELQNSSLDVGTPLAVLHESSDGVWVYGMTHASSGWVKKEKIVFCGLEDFKNYLEKIPCLVVTSPKADIFLDADLTQYYDYVRMGMRFALKVNTDSPVVEAIIPFQGSDSKFVERSVYLKKEDVSLGYLPYTARNIINQAFKLLNAPYGWGGINGEQDCSSFLQQVFSTVGINLPRNSSAQAKIGRSLGDFKNDSNEKTKLNALGKTAVCGITILRLKGHVLLYLGMYNDKPYAIHETYGYSEKTKQGFLVRAINRVVVTDLSLGKGSKKGSLLERIVDVRVIE